MSLALADELNVSSGGPSISTGQGSSVGCIRISIAQAAAG